MFPELAFAPISLTSATEGLNVRQTIALAEELFGQSRTRVPTPRLNRAIKEVLTLRGPSHKAGTKPPKILYASQIAVAPPTIVCFVNDVRSFDTSFQRFLVNQLRERLPLSEVPIRLLFRQHRSRTPHSAPAPAVGPSPHPAQSKTPAQIGSGSWKEPQCAAAGLRAGQRQEAVRRHDPDLHAAVDRVAALIRGVGRDGMVLPEAHRTDPLGRQTLGGQVFLHGHRAVD